MRLDFLLEAVGPGTERLEALPPAPACTSPPAGGRLLREALSPRPRARSVGGDRGRDAGASTAESSPSGASHSGSCSAFAIVPTRAGWTFAVRTASEDGHTGHQGYVTDLLAVLLEGDDAARRSSTPRAPGDARGRSRPLRGPLLPRARARDADGCGSGLASAAPCRSVTAAIEAVRGWPGGARGGDRDRDGGRIGALMGADLSLELCGIRLEHPILNGSGTFDAIAARRAFGDAVDERLPSALRLEDDGDGRAGEPAAAPV